MSQFFVDRHEAVKRLTSNLKGGLSLTKPALPNIQKYVSKANITPLCKLYNEITLLHRVTNTGILLYNRELIMYFIINVTIIAQNPPISKQIAKVSTLASIAKYSPYSITYEKKEFVTLLFYLSQLTLIITLL